MILPNMVNSIAIVHVSCHMYNVHVNLSSSQNVYLYSTRANATLTCRYINVHIYMYMYIYACTHVHVYIYACIHVRIQCRCKYVYACTCTCRSMYCMHTCNMYVVKSRELPIGVGTENLVYHARRKIAHETGPSKLNKYTMYIYPCTMLMNAGIGGEGSEPTCVLDLLHGFYYVHVHVHVYRYGT